MTNDLGNYRKSYIKSQLLESEASQNPFELFEKWFKEVDAHFNYIETNAMTLSTIGTDGFPKGRVVLLKEFSEEGFIFYTNYQSEKAEAIAVTPKVCLSFFWQEAERQVIIKGTATKTIEAKSVAYFKSRPKGSQLGAVASDQSQVVANRQVLEEALEKLQEQYKDKEIPKPKDWGGYIVKPISFEFWQGRENRLHDRLLYAREKDKTWKLVRLAP